MKRCPECRRNYYDDSLLYCLDDGSALIDVPTSIDGSATELISPPDSESATRTFDSPTLGLPIASPTPIVSSKRNSMIIGLVGIVLVAAVGIASYLYYDRGTIKQIESIAVMPFVNESGDSNLEYLSDGMTETLMNSLSRLPGLSVKARGSVFRYKGKEVDAQAVGKELGVQAVLNGRVVRHEGDITVFLELVDANTGDRRWGEQYTKPMTSLVALQNQIAGDVSQNLRSRLSGTDQQRVAKNYTENSEAYQLYLQGRFFWNKRTADGFKAAIAYFEKALEIDPNYALAHTGLADCYALLAIYERAFAKETMPKAKEEALLALSLDPNLAEAHASLGQVLQTYEYDFAGAEREYKRAIELNSNYASAHQWYGELLANVGRFDESQASLEHALELDPFSLIINRMKGSTLVFAGKWDQGMEQMKKTVAMDPNFPGVYYDLFLVNQLKGNYSVAVDHFARWRELNGDPPTSVRARDAFAKGGWRGFLIAMTSPDNPFRVYHHYHMVTFYASLGNKESTIKELMIAYDERENDLVWMKVDPRLDPLRDDPRFREMIAKVGFPS